MHRTGATRMTFQPPKLPSGVCLALLCVHLSLARAGMGVDQERNDQVVDQGMPASSSMRCLLFSCRRSYIKQAMMAARKETQE